MAAGPRPKSGSGILPVSVTLLTSAGDRLLEWRPVSPLPLLAVISTLLFAGPALAQDAGGDLPDAPSAASRPPRRRMFHLILTPHVEASAAFAPLTTGDKFRLAADHLFDRTTLLKAAASAGLSQALDSPEGFGQGGEGYGKRYGAAIANQASSDFFSRFAFPVLFRQDPRYFRAAQGTGADRLGYALTRVVKTRTDKGESDFNYSFVLGSLVSAGLSNAYYPEIDRNVSRTLRTAGLKLAVEAGLNVLKEFLPDLRGRKKKREIDQKQDPASAVPGPAL